VGKRVPDEFVLLCETCGYEIEGLPADGACPECGRANSNSWPSRRTGSPAQQHTTILGLMRTWHATLTRPGRLFDRAVAGSRRDRVIREVALAVASVVGGAALLMPRVLSELNRDHADAELAAEARYIAALMTFGIVPLSIVVFMALAILTFIESRGIRFWGPRRGWRITPAIARTICAHASVGWVLGSVLMVAGHLLGLYLAQFPNRYNLGIFRGPMQLAPITLPALGFLAGMLTFEVLVYIGMSRMKFANRERPPGPAEAPASPLDASMPAASMPSSPTSPSDDDRPRA
jgi:hypothetical protein